MVVVDDGVSELMFFFSSGVWNVNVVPAATTVTPLFLAGSFLSPNVPDDIQTEHFRLRREGQQQDVDKMETHSSHLWGKTAP
jgi:hypothetical protein